MRGSGVRESSELVVLYEISVRVGEQPLSHVRHRYRDFHKLQVTLRENYPHLFAERQELPLPMTPLLEGFLDGPTITPAAPLPPFPRKHLFRAGWDPAVVTERVVALDAWLSAVCDKLQFASLELVGFLNVPLYAAIRLLSGDLQARAHAPHAARARALRPPPRCVRVAPRPGQRRVRRVRRRPRVRLSHEPLKHG
jgi:hypothetical protein